MTKITFSALPVLSVFIALSNSSLQNLTFIGILPLSGEEGHIGLSVKPFIERAVGHVNRDDNILNGYNLTVEWVDSKCDGGSATKAMFDALHSTKRIVFIYGGYCSYVTKSVAESMAYFNTWQISFFNTDPTLSDSVTYKNFLRVIPNELDYNLVWVKFLESNNWNRVVLLYQDASSGFTTYAYTHNALSSQLKAAGVKILSTFSVTENPEVAFSDIKAWDAKIIIGNFGSDMAQRIICMAYHSDMYGHRYVWLLTQVTAYPPNWWEGSENCTREQMETTLNGHFTVDIVTSFYSETDASYATYFSPQEIPDPGKHNIQDLFISLSEDTKHNRYTSYAYDGVWLMANALHRFIEDSKPSYPDWEQWYNITNASEITKGSFTGLTGEVQFLHRSRLGYLQLLQKQGTNYRQVGLLNMSNGNLSLATEIYWHGNDQAPLDHTVIQRKDIRPNIIIHGVLMALATLGLVLAISFLSVNIKYASHRHIKMSSPKMNNIIVAGCIFIYSTVFVMRIHVDSSNTTRQVICIARTWALFFGFSLSFGALFAKTWRVYTIFNSPHGQKRMITDGMLFIVVVLLLCLDLILLITWAIVDPLQVEETELDRIEEKNTIISRILYTCESERMNIWTAITYSYKGLLLVIGCFFAWQTRHVNIPALNDSKYIGMSVYNVVIMSTSAVAISYVITSQQDHSDLIIGLLIILCTTITLCLVFVPKIMHLRQDPKGLLPRPRLSMKSSSSSRKSMLAGQNSSDTFTSAENKISQLERDLVLNQAKLNLVTQEMKSLASKCNAAVDSSTSTISNQVEHLSLQNFSQQCNTTTTHCTHSTNNEPTDEIARTQHTTAKTDCISVGSDSKL